MITQLYRFLPATFPTFTNQCIHIQPISLRPVWVRQYILMFILSLSLKLPPANSQLPSSPHRSLSLHSPHCCPPVPVSPILLPFNFRLQFVLYFLQMFCPRRLPCRPSSCLPSLYNSFSTFCAFSCSSSCSSHPHTHCSPSLPVIPPPPVTLPLQLIMDQTQQTPIQHRDQPPARRTYNREQDLRQCIHLTWKSFTSHRHLPPAHATWSHRIPTFSVALDNTDTSSLAVVLLVSTARNRLHRNPYYISTQKPITNTDTQRLIVPPLKHLTKPLSVTVLRSVSLQSRWSVYHYHLPCFGRAVHGFSTCPCARNLYIQTIPPLRSDPS